MRFDYRISHDNIATMMVELINAAGGRAHERTIGTFPPRGELRKDDSGRHDTTIHVVTPDLVSTNVCTYARRNPTLTLRLKPIHFKATSEGTRHPGNKSRRS